MSVKQMKILILCLLAGLLLYSFGCVSLTSSDNTKGDSSDLPVVGFTISTELNQRDAFFTQLRRFAAKHSLNFTLAVHSPDKASFGIKLDGDSFFITAIGTTQSPTEIDIGLYELPYMPTPTPQAAIDELMDDLKVFINQIPNIRTTERKHALIVTTHTNWRDEILFERMRALADKHGLEYELSFYGSDPSDNTCFLVKIEGNGFQIISDCHLNTLDTIGIEFYLDYYGDPSRTSEATLDELFHALRNLLSEIPSVSITEE